MALLLEAPAHAFNHRPDFQPTDAWVSQTVAAALQTAVIGIPELYHPDPAPPSTRRRLLPRTKATEGKDPDVIGENEGLFKDLIATARERIRFYESKASRESRELSYQPLRDEMEQGIEFTLAVNSRLSNDEDLKTALVQEGRKSRTQYTKDGVSTDEIKTRVKNNLGFAYQFLLKRLSPTSGLGDIVKMYAVARNAEKEIFPPSRLVLYKP